MSNSHTRMNADSWHQEWILEKGGRCPVVGGEKKKKKREEKKKKKEFPLRKERKEGEEASSRGVHGHS